MWEQLSNRPHFGLVLHYAKSCVKQGSEAGQPIVACASVAEIARRCIFLLGFDCGVLLNLIWRQVSHCVFTVSNDLIGLDSESFSGSRFGWKSCAEILQFSTSYQPVACFRPTAQQNVSRIFCPDSKNVKLWHRHLRYAHTLYADIPVAKQCQCS